jgi:peptidoglycan/LPS O-acetylase OafA/YrhL
MAGASHVAYLDGWRGLAILFVLAEHFGGVPTGNLGVQVFFVLSGMLMAHVLFVDKVPIRTFYQRRIARILPVFYLYLATVVVVAMFAGVAFDWTHILYSATFLRTYLPQQFTIWSDPLPLGHTWSLNIEEHAYILLSLLALLCARLRTGAAPWVLGGAALACLGFGYYYTLHPPTGSPAPLRSEVGAYGLLASAALSQWLHGRAIGERRALLVLAAMAAVMLASAVMGQEAPRLLLYVLLPSTLALGVNVLHAAPAWLRNVLGAPWLVWFGVTSYSLYLWQQPFFRLQATDALNRSSAFALVCAIAVAAASYYGFERPARQWIRGLGARRPAGEGKLAAAA